MVTVHHPVVKRVVIGMHTFTRRVWEKQEFSPCPWKAGRKVQGEIRGEIARHNVRDFVHVVSVDFLAWKARKHQRLSQSLTSRTGWDL
eukprot:877335-Rhodomonas_salina.2